MTFDERVVLRGGVLPALLSPRHRPSFLFTLILECGDPNNAPPQAAAEKEEEGEDEEGFDAVTPPPQIFTIHYSLYTPSFQ